MNRCKTSEWENISMRQSDASFALNPSYAVVISGENEWNSKISSSTARIATACILLLFLPNHFWLTLRQRRKSFRRNYKRWANWQMVGQRLTGDGPIIRGSLAGTRKRGHRPRHLRQVTFWSSGLGCISSPEGRRILLYGLEYFDTTFKHFNTGFKGTNYVSFCVFCIICVYCILLLLLLVIWPCNLHQRQMSWKIVFNPKIAESSSIHK